MACATCPIVLLETAASEAAAGHILAAAQSIREAATELLLDHPVVARALEGVRRRYEAGVAPPDFGYWIPYIRSLLGSTGPERQVVTHAAPAVPCSACPGATP